MPTSLTDTRTAVRRLLDDTDTNPLFADAEIDDALKPAQYEVAQLVVGAGGSNLFNAEVNKTSDATGLVDLSAEAPLKINYVAQVAGSQRFQVQPSRNTDWRQTVQAPTTLVIGYVARPAFPSAPANPFLWGSSVEAPMFDRLMVCIAANEIWAKTGDPPLKALVDREEKLREQVVASINIPMWTVQPLRLASRFPAGGGAGFQWVSPTRDRLQLVFA